MADRWFRLPTETIDAEDGPKYRDLEGVTGFSGNTIGNSPRWIVRFYGDESTLDEIASESDATELTDSEAAQKFENASGRENIPEKNWNATEVNDSFGVDN